MIKVGRERGFPTLADDVSVLELERRHAVALADHMDGIDNRDEDDLCLAVAHALGLDPKEPEDQEAFLLRLAAAWTYNDLLES